jgi:energy-coupling factor transporter transmembrane protein EcfT
MLFIFLAVMFMFVGRKLGWAFSKLLYSAPMGVVVLFSLFWGVAVAGSIRGLILWQQPGAVLRWILGYALGAYVAIPNYELLDEASVPPDSHVLLEGLPLGIYVACSIALAFLLW